MPLSICSSDSLLSIGSQGSLLSIGSVNSVLSVGSVASAGSLASWASAGSIGSAFSAGTIGSTFAAGAKGLLRGCPARVDWRVSALVIGATAVAVGVGWPLVAAHVYQSAPEAAELAST